MNPFSKMRLYRHHNDVAKEDRGVSAALGNFDGLHRGHQAVIGEAGRIARAEGLPLAVFTTEPHPGQFFRPDAEAFRLTPFRERAKLMEAFGADVLLCVPFDAALAGMDPEHFVDEVLVRGLGVRHVTVGYDYRFGKGRAGTVETLEVLGRARGFSVHVIAPVAVGVEGAAGEVYSSTLIREALKTGQARRAAALLGHWWTVSGRVAHGDARGRTIGFPTANLSLDEDTIVPKFGVYAVRCMIGEEAGELIHPGVANLGVRPTAGGGEARLEIHLFDFDADLYGKHVRAEFVGFIREERKFQEFDGLREQITKDAAAARQLLADPDNAREHLGTPLLDDYLQRNP